MLLYNYQGGGKMKNRLIIILVLSVLLALILSTTCSAVAEEIKISLLATDFSQSEKDFAMANLRLKFEDGNLPNIISIEKLYDFNHEPLYGLYEFEGYYMIVIRNTGSILERGEGNSPYFGKSESKYYGGFGKYFILRNGEFYSIASDRLASYDDIEQMASAMEYLRELDYQDYLEALDTPMPMGQSNRHRVTKLGKSDQKFNYFAQTINTMYRYDNNSKVDAANKLKENDIDRILYSMGSEGTVYGTYYYCKFSYGYDLLFPKTMYNSCSLVAMTIVLQYYERLGLNKKLCPMSDGIDMEEGWIKFLPTDSRAESIMRELRKHVKVLSVNNPNVDGAATYVDIDGGFESYFKENGISCKSTHFTSYTNIKKAVDSGNPAIMTVGAGKGWDVNNKGVDISRHNVIVCGYTKNALGILDEFICHSGWFDKVHAESDGRIRKAKLFVNKFYAAGNVYISAI